MTIGLLVNPYYGPRATDFPKGDQRMHEIWASSAENVAFPMGKGDWVATDFEVNQAYIRSVEVAAGADGPGKLQLAIYDLHQQELASGEAAVVDWRAKYTFERPVDVRAHLGKRLLLVARNVWPVAVRTYFTKNDRVPAATSYRSCGNNRIIDCPSREAGDLSAIVVGRWHPW
ncbi:hypothetical protein O7635_07800 [Asanoa sp. WMMD1127]|uniref:hypothetical protein n=1 Tax=Asanoa sp. WMMD1127 TaxID=3016107 RepID=UPI00241599BE|nr:hypothetical protein [Asanoa sp. WMMD1127]MDG4821754.1 hypothetical protein [Asanoa sp. WMMD1127]